MGGANVDLPGRRLEQRPRSFLLIHFVSLVLFVAKVRLRRIYYEIM
jgi:hypothetical protein